MRIRRSRACRGGATIPDTADPVADFAPITMLTSAPLVLVVPSASNIQSVHDLIAAAKSRPLTYGSAGIGSTPAQFTAFLKQDVAKWAQVIKAAGIKGE